MNHMVNLKRALATLSLTTAITGMIYLEPSNAPLRAQASAAPTNGTVVENPSKTDANQSPKRNTESDPQLRMLFDYTTFHIGLYTTLVTALLSLMTFGSNHNRVTQNIGYLKFTVLCFLLAGAAGGAIASNIPQYPSYFLYSNAKLSVFWSPPFLEYSLLAHIEHLAFWVGIGVATFGFLRPNSKCSGKHRPDTLA